MKHLITLLLLLVATLTLTGPQILYAQQTDQAAYVIEDGQRQEGVIRYAYWDSNPYVISFSKNRGRTYEDYKAGQIREFGIQVGEHWLIYRSFDLTLDLSNNREENLPDR